MQSEKLRPPIRFHAAAVVGSFLAFAAAAGVSDASPTTQPATAAAPETQPSAGTPRTLSQLGNDLIQISGEIQKAGGTPEVLADAVKRADAAPKLIDLVKRQDILLDEYIAAAGNSLPTAALDQMKQHNTAMLYLLRDPVTVEKVDKAAQEKVSDATLEAFSTRLLSQWIAAGKDEDAQIRLTDQIEKVDVAHPENTQLTGFTFMLSRDAASDDLADRLMSIAAGEMHNDLAKSLQARVPLIERARAAKKQLASLAGKPLVVAGKTSDGKEFTTAGWRGKVILIDFWATWSGPCKDDLPRINAVFEKYHAKGLEIVGVANDFSPTDLTGFTANHSMSWPELFDTAAAAARQWNPITIGYGIRAIPTMFLIDKKGTCRTVEARETMEDMIPKLLAE